jgi:hypothetical protein
LVSNTRPLTGRLVVILATLATGVGLAQQPAGDRIGPREPAPDGFSPNAFLARRAAEQAFPLAPGDPRFEQAAARTFWLFQGVAYRGADPLGAAWTSLGPLTTLQPPTGGNSSENVSGRVSALAISPTCQLDGPCRLWVGTAGGGVWRTDDAMNPVDVAWRWVSQGLGTNNIGSLGLDPNDPTGNTIYVGTGETNQPNNSGAGTGLYRSTDGGDRWTRVSTTILDPTVSAAPIDFTFTRGIAAVVVEPANPQVIYVATTSAMLGMTGVRGGQTQTTGVPQPRVGLYRTRDGGTTWELTWVPPLDPVLPPNPHLGPGVGDTMFGVRDIQLDPRDPSIVYATAFNNAIHRSAPSLEGGDASFKPVYAIVGFERFRDLAMFDVTVQDGRTRMYVYNGTARNDTQGLYRLDDADVPAASLVTADGAGGLVNTSAWIGLTSNDTSQPGATSRGICRGQCFYDLVVAVPDGRPDTVLVGGVADPNVGEPTIRSTNAGASFFGFGNDAQNPRNRSHVDVRAIVFHPQAPDIAFVGSDGGVVRNDGSFSNNSGICAGSGIAQCPTMLAEVPTELYFLNRGLQTMQFYNVALDPQAPLTRLIGGLQDNSTIWRDGSGDPLVWTTLFPFGDGTSASGFHPTRSDVLFASFQSTNFFTNFRNGDPNGWVRTNRPITASGERGSITQSTGRQFLTFDRVNPDTQFTAFQHVWRTQNNGGDQAFLEANCGFPGSSIGTCGDWVPLGVAYPFLPGTDPDSPTRKPGDLTSDFYGADRVGGLVVAAERTPADAGTLWAATNFGRLFVSTNADAPGPDVTFTRIDTPATPGRFVTRIAADPNDPNVAFVSYSGFDTLTPSTPGHVFRVTYDPNTRIAVYESFDHDLGDIPVNTLAWDHLAGDLYAATDYGPLVLRAGSATWTVAGVGFPLALMVDLEIVPEQRVLVAATHGLGIYWLRLPAL